MKKLIYLSMINPTTDGGYQMAEVNAAEYSEGWDGDTKAYLDNLDVDDMEYTSDENILSTIEQNYGGHDPLAGSICIVMLNGKPTEIYWAADSEEDAPMKKTVYRIYQAVAELKHRPASVSEIVEAQDSENWNTLGEYPDAESAVDALHNDYGTALVWKYPTYFRCEAAFVEKVTETVEDGMIIERDSEHIEDCDMPADEDGNDEEPFTAESFGDSIPFNWVEILEYLNKRFVKGTDPEELWEAYWNGECPNAPKPITEQYDVEYSGGESRQIPGAAVDYMLVSVPVSGDDGDAEEVELYAEMENPTWNKETEQFDDETATYSELRDAIIAQAKQHGINPVCLKFWYAGYAD